MTDEYDVISQTVRDLSEQLREFSEDVTRIETKQDMTQREIENARERMADLEADTGNLENRVTQLETQQNRVPPKLERLPDNESLNDKLGAMITKTELAYLGGGIVGTVGIVEFAIEYFL